MFRPRALSLDSGPSQPAEITGVESRPLPPLPRCAPVLPEQRHGTREGNNRPAWTFLGRRTWLRASGEQKRRERRVSPTRARGYLFIITSNAATITYRHEEVKSSQEKGAGKKKPHIIYTSHLPVVPTTLSERGGLQTMRGHKTNHK